MLKLGWVTFYNNVSESNSPIDIGNEDSEL